MIITKDLSMKHLIIKIKFELYYINNNSLKKKVAIKRLEKVGPSLSREYEILFELKDNEYIVNILVKFQINKQNKRIFIILDLNKTF